MATMRMLRFGFLVTALQLGGVPALAQTSVGGLPSGFTAPGLPFGPTSTVATVAAPTAAMALANPGGLRFGGASGISGLGTSAPGLPGNAGGLRFGGASVSGTLGGGGLSSGGGGIANVARRQPDDVTGSIGSGGGAPAGAGISGGAGFSPRPTDAHFDPLSGSGLR